MGFVGWSGAGKTTLLTAVVERLSADGVRVGVLKHAHQGFDLDRPGKDSHRARAAGATRVLVASSERWALLAESAGGGGESGFGALVARLAAEPIDLIVVEGFAAERYPKIEVYRAALGWDPKCWPHDPDLVALVTDAELAAGRALPRFEPGDAPAVSAFILERMMRRPMPTGVAHGGT